MSNAHAVHSFGSLDTDIVIDLGCCSYERNGRLEDSIQTLIKRFKPKLLYGFDPHPALREGIGDVFGTLVVTTRKAAWKRAGPVGLDLNGNCTHVDLGSTNGHVEAFDIATWVRSLPDVRIVLKVDTEGAEYVLLPHLIEQGLIDRFSRVIVEWHTGQYANGYESDRASILSQIPCPVEEWQ